MGRLEHIMPALKETNDSIFNCPGLAVKLQNSYSIVVFILGKKEVMEHKAIPNNKLLNVTRLQITLNKYEKAKKNETLRKKFKCRAFAIKRIDKSPRTPTEK